MGFGINLISFALLILLTAALLIYLLVTGRKTALKLLSGIWILTILFMILISIKNTFDRPIRLTKGQIAGNYRIGKSFYPGKNADWQYEHFKFTITSTDSIYFYVINKDTISRTFKSKLKYLLGPPDLWTVERNITYHLAKYPPTLYRGHKKFYYVLHSDLYGNMFFRKE